MTDRNIHTLAGAYAIDALDDHERTEFESHLDVCPECRREVTELRTTASSLATITDADPPESLRAAVMSQIQSVRPMPPDIPAAHKSASKGSKARRRVKLLGAVAAALVVIGGAGSAIWQPWDTGTHSSPEAEPTAQKVLQARDAQRVSVDVPDNGSVTLVRSRSVGRAVVVAPDMKTAPEGKDFELWLQRPGSDMEPAGLMPKDDDGPVMLEGDTTTASAVGITLEPQGGSAEPTTDPVALFDLSDTAS